jgi:hypothetical protein
MRKQTPKFAADATVVCVESFASDSPERGTVVSGP